MTVCEEEGCNRPVHARGLCRKHYDAERWADKSVSSREFTDFPSDMPSLETAQALQRTRVLLEEARTWLLDILNLQQDGYLYNMAVNEENLRNLTERIDNILRKEQ